MDALLVRHESYCDGYPKKGFFAFSEKELQTLGGLKDQVVEIGTGSKLERIIELVKKRGYEKIMLAASPTGGLEQSFLRQRAVETALLLAEKIDTVLGRKICETSSDLLGRQKIETYPELAGPPIFQMDGWSEFMKHTKEAFADRENFWKAVFTGNLAKRQELELPDPTIFISEKCFRLWEKIRYISDKKALFLGISHSEILTSLYLRLKKDAPFRDFNFLGGLLLTENGAVRLI